MPALFQATKDTPLDVLTHFMQVQDGQPATFVAKLRNTLHNIEWVVTHRNLAPARVEKDYE